jgi:type IV pilus assembly protein PilC
MSLFSYIVKDKTGKTTKGILEAESKAKLIEYFHKEGSIIFSIAESKKTAGFLSKKTGKIKIDDLVVFSRQFTTLIESGISIVEALEILKDQTEKHFFKEVLNVISMDIKKGEFLSNALAKHPNVFPEIYINMVEAAEASGNLPEILERISVYLEKSNALRKKVISSLYYPIVIVVMAILITSILVFKVIPTFKGIFETLGGKLPLPTQILLTLSTFLSKKETLIAMVAFIFIGSFLFFRYIRTEKGKRRYHQVLLRLPVFGNLIRKISIARFARTFATLVRSGVPIIKSLEIVAKTSGNKIIEDAVNKSKKFIQEGQPIASPLEESGVFPLMVIKMIAIGQRSGKLEEMLSKVAQFYEEQTDAMVAGLSSLIEPIIIVFLGVIVGGIVISLFLPIIQITQYLGVK